MTEDRKFGRFYVHDERKRGFTLSNKAMEAAPVTSKHWRLTEYFDQGNTSQCVSYSGHHWLRAAPVGNSPAFTFEELYLDCQKNDVWDGESYDGTSVQALFKVLKRLEYVSEYRWAFDLETVVNHVLTTGPMVIGVNWYSNMMRTDIHGFIHATGRMEGGHATLIIGANRKKRCPDKSLGAFRLHNSWSRNWGEQGRAWLSFTDFEKLLKMDGEAATAVEVLQ